MTSRDDTVVTWPSRNCKKWSEAYPKKIWLKIHWTSKNMKFSNSLKIKITSIFYVETHRTPFTIYNFISWRSLDRLNWTFWTVLSCREGDTDADINLCPVLSWGQPSFLFQNVLILSIRFFSKRYLRNREPENMLRRPNTFFSVFKQVSYWAIFLSNQTISSEILWKPTFVSDSSHLPDSDRCLK